MTDDKKYIPTYDREIDVSAIMDTSDEPRPPARVRESVPYIGFLRGNTPEIKAENSRRSEEALRIYREKVADGYMPTCEGYILRTKK